MIGDHLSHKYIKEEDKIGILVKETIRTETHQTIGQIVEIEEYLEIDLGKQVIVDLGQDPEPVPIGIG